MEIYRVKLGFETRKDSFYNYIIAYQYDLSPNISFDLVDAKRTTIHPYLYFQNSKAKFEIQLLDYPNVQFLPEKILPLLDSKFFSLDSNIYYTGYGLVSRPFWLE